MHWTLFLNDEDPGNDYMYTWPDEKTERRSVLPLTPGTAVPENLGALYTAGELPPGERPSTVEELKRTGIEHAFRLVTLTGPKIDSAERRRAEMERPFVSGKTDLLPGVWPKPVYGQAKYEQQFLIASGGSGPDRVKRAVPGEWEAALSRVRDYLNAATAKMRLIFDTDPGWYRLGDCHATVKKQTDGTETIAVTAKLDPYRYERFHSAEPWMWDDFSFIDGVIREYGDIDVASLEYGFLVVPMRGEDVQPEFWSLFGETNIEEMELPSREYDFVEACAALRAYIREVLDYDGGGEDPGDGLAGKLNAFVEAIRTECDKILQNRDWLPVLDNTVKRLEDAAEAAGAPEGTDDADRDDLLTYMDRYAIQAEYIAVENLVQASTDQLHWYGVYFFGGYRKAEENADGDRSTLTLGGSRTGEERLLYLRGAGHISVKMRGKTL